MFEKSNIDMERKMSATELERHRAAQKAAQKVAQMREHDLQDERGAYIVNEEEGSEEKLKQLVKEMRLKFGEDERREAA